MLMGGKKTHSLEKSVDYRRAYHQGAKFYTKWLQDGESWPLKHEAAVPSVPVSQILSRGASWCAESVRQTIHTPSHQSHLPV